jgi:hypothetical protein
MARQYGSIGATGGLVDVNETLLRQYYSGVDRNEAATIPFVPPPNPGNSGNGKGGAPGQTKKEQAYVAHSRFVRHKRKRHEFENDATSFIPAQYLSPGATRSSLLVAGSIDGRKVIRRITISPSGHTVRKQ